MDRRAMYCPMCGQIAGTNSSRCAACKETKKHIGGFAADNGEKTGRRLWTYSVLLIICTGLLFSAIIIFLLGGNSPVATSTSTSSVSVNLAPVSKADADQPPQTVGQAQKQPARVIDTTKKRPEPGPILVMAPAFEDPTKNPENDGAWSEVIEVPPGMGVYWAPVRDIWIRANKKHVIHQEIGQDIPSICELLDGEQITEIEFMSGTLKPQNFPVTRR